MMERITRFYPAFDKRNPDPAKNYGIHGVNLVFVLKGELGAVNFLIHTNWHLHDVAQEFLNKDGESSLIELFFMPRAADIGYHSPKPMFEGQKVQGSTKWRWEDSAEMKKEDGSPLKVPIGEETGTFSPCEYLDGKPCYSDGSTLDAQRFMDVLVSGGDEELWKALEKYYEDTFGELR